MKPHRLAWLTPQSFRVVRVVRGSIRRRLTLNFLQRQGFKSLKRVKGGITAWSEELDGNVPRY